MCSTNAAVELLTRNLERHPDKTAYLCGDEILSYAELDRASRRFASLLKNKGIVAGERVVIALPDCFAFPVALLGCLLTGAVAVTAGTALEDEDLEYIISDSGAVLLVSQAESRPVHSTGFAGIKHIFCDNQEPTERIHPSDSIVEPYQPQSEDFAFMLYSSGSTGQLKGVPHRHASLLLPCKLMGEALLGITGEDVIFSTSKLSCGYGLINSLSFPLYFGATAILHPYKPDIRSILRILVHQRPSILFSVPTIYTQIVLSSTEPELKLPMRLCCSAGEALPKALFEEWQRRTGLEIIDGIGASEFSHHFICNLPGQAIPGSIGRLVPGYRIRLVDDNGNDVPSGSEGHLLVSGGTRAPRYWNLPEKSNETMLPDGFTRTGDILLERNGYYYYRGRSDDMIKVNAQWVSPVCVEDALASHRLVAECAVGSMSIDTITRPMAYVVLVPGIKPSPALVIELKKHIQSQLPNYMCPASILFLVKLPRTPTGKIQRFKLREELP